MNEGGESGNNKQIQMSLEATEMWFLKQTRIPWTARVTNNDCLGKANGNGTFHVTIRKRHYSMVIK